MDESTKKKVLQLFPSPIFVVGCKHGDQVHAFGGSWLGQCSFAPPIVWVGVRKDSVPHDFFGVGKYFTISVLGADQDKVARGFFKTPEPKNGKFGKIPFHLSGKGVPVLDDCLAWVECKVVSKAAPGDHTVFFGEVIDCGFTATNSPVLTTVNSKMKYGG
jgi:flavin reductase (DIM6/NTAB) family NADH-FMN oxidoreductase RutF